MISTWKIGSEEYAKLEAVAKMLTAYGKQKYWVGDTYFDYGQDWKWTTILCEKDDSEWGAFQALYPVDQERILSAVDGPDLLSAVQKVLSH